MAQKFQKYALHLESSQNGTVDRKRVGDPPGYQPSVARDAVCWRKYTLVLTFGKVHAKSHYVFGARQSDRCHDSRPIALL